MATAEATPRANKVTRKVTNIALQWLRDEISTGDAQKQLGASSINATVYRCGIAIRQARRDGLLSLC